MVFRYITINTYYDDGFSDSPIKNYIKYSDRMVYHIGKDTHIELKVVPSQINLINNSIVMAYEAIDSQAIEYYHSGINNRMLYLSLMIDPHYYIYEEYYNYQPQFNNTRRHLDTPNEVSAFYFITFLYFDYNLLS